MISAKYEKYKEVLKQLTDAKKKAEEKKKQLVKLLKDAKALKAADGALNDLKDLLDKSRKVNGKLSKTTIAKAQKLIKAA